MRNRVMKLSICCLASGMLFAGSMPVYAEEAGQNGAAQENAAQPEETQAEAQGELAFAQCEEYINVRSGADTDSEVVAKIYNNGAATVLEQTGDWYKIRSGNAEGYVKAEYFVTGEQAAEIAEKAAYNVAVVHPEHLNVRTQPAEDTEVLDVAQHAEELEVVAYDGDWMKVALGNDVYGYVNAYYVDYKTYYPEAVTLEEEQARLEAEKAAAEAYEEPEYTEDTYEEPEYTEDTYEEPEYTEDTYTEPEYTETEAPAETEPQYTETEAPAETEPQYTETEAPVETEPQYTETEAPAQTEPEYTETEAPAETEAPTSGTGADIAAYAQQFIGNPYVWGGTSLTNGADCSGFVQSVFANFGIGLARTAADQSYGGTQVSIDSIQPGDLLFYNSTGSIDHVAIYIGGGMIVHAANSSTGITTSSYNYSTPVSAARYW